ncbi:Armadillo-type fold [Phytophthora cinnamomi]|uniref:Armadillo-type fold n=1 Tax=Phytophthora cinnamomi TaxID=4785 RepID=UPI00355AA692|nr:Armadillo-type fold [Phytophthora cinnamomi]
MSSPRQDKDEQKQEEKAVFRTITPNDQADRLNYRSMAVASAPPAFGLMGQRSPLEQLGGGFPAPMAFNMASKKSAGVGKKPEATGASPSFGMRVDRTKYVNVTPRDLPPAPFRLEMHTHFHVKLESTQRVCGVVGIKLCELDTDFEFKADKCKWKVEYRRNGGAQRVSLNIVIFKTNKEEYVVEVQRREGDVTALMHLYHELKSFFRRSQLLSEKTPSSNGVKRAAPKPLPKLPLSPESIQDGVSALKGLLESKYADAQMQGVLGAISMSTIEETRSGMAGLVPQLVTLAQSKNANVTRLVSAALARLCDHPQCRQAFIQSDGWQFIVDCAAGGADVKPEVQRESLHVVETLCPLYHDELAKSENAGRVLELVQEWQKIEDPRLKKHACNAHRALKEAGVLA